jgi:hypothetical protein
MVLRLGCRKPVLAGSIDCLSEDVRERTGILGSARPAR